MIDAQPGDPAGPAFHAPAVFPSTWPQNPSPTAAKKFFFGMQLRLLEIRKSAMRTIVPGIRNFVFGLEYFYSLDYLRFMNPSLDFVVELENAPLGRAHFHPLDVCRQVPTDKNCEIKTQTFVYCRGLGPLATVRELEADDPSAGGKEEEA
jgi:hypothetical protein